jgi:uncharacterized membrane protein YbhN (UPF0104 family)
MPQDQPHAPVDGSLTDGADAAVGGGSGSAVVGADPQVPERPDASGRWGGGSWRSIFFAPVGDGQTRRRGSDGIRIGVCVLVIVVCWLATKVIPSSEKALIGIVTPPPDGIRWLVTTVWWVASIGLTVAVIVLALVSRRWAVIRDTLLSGAGAWLVCVLLTVLLGADGGAPHPTAPLGFALSFPVARVAATVGVATAALPYLSRWIQRIIRVTIVLLALATVVGQTGLPISVLASLAVGVLATAAVHLAFGAPLGLVSAAEVAVLIGDLGIDATDIAPVAVQEWGVGRFAARSEGKPIAVDVYGLDASDAQLLAKTARFMLYRDSGPTLTLTRRQQVEHEAYLTLLADRAGARVSRVLAAGPAGPARDALLITCPPPGQPLSGFAAFVLPPAPDDPPETTGATDNQDGTVEQEGTVEQGATDNQDGTVEQDGTDASGRTDVSRGSEGTNGTEPTTADEAGKADLPTLGDDALDGIFVQLAALRAAGIAHGALAPGTILVDDDGRSGFVDMRSASTVARTEQLDRDVAAALAVTSLVVGPERATAAAARVLPVGVLEAALPFLLRAALNPGASRAMRGKKRLLAGLREEGAKAAGVEVPELIEPRRISWVTLLLVIGTLIGGWALIGVLVNVTQSWSTITGAKWGWVAVSFVLAQAVYPALAVTTVGSVTDTMPYGRTVALEVANTFVSLAGGSMGALATRVRFFQQQGYDATLAVSSGVLISTASWIVKGGMFLLAIPIAFSQFHFASEPADTGGGSGSSTAHLVWIIVIAVVVVGVVLGLVLAIPRWRRRAAAKLRPKASEVWGHLKLLSTHPRNLFEIFGGEVAGQLLVALSLGAALHAFDQHLSLAALLIVLTLGSMLGGVSPVPGGMGVVEAGMIIGLTAAGVPEDDAVAAVFVQRLFTAYLPPIWGWFCLIWMRKKEYL